MTSTDKRIHWFSDPPKVPPAINQFRLTLEKNHAAELFRLLGKYKPETKQAKKGRLLAEVRSCALPPPPSSLLLLLLCY
jgi:hypothetical protein